MVGYGVESRRPPKLTEGATEASCRGGSRAATATAIADVQARAKPEAVIEDCCRRERETGANWASRIEGRKSMFSREVATETVTTNLRL